MQEDIKCPQCGGNRFKDLGDNTYKCMYCGSTFTHKGTVNEPPTSPSTPPSEQLNINEGGYTEKPRYRSGNNSYTQPPVGRKSRITAALLAIIIGDFGIHHFYLRHIGLGFLYLIFFWTWIPAIIGFIEGIIYLCMSDEEFDYKYN